jgi:uncharacterized membrane protein YidH (DUF202 family)
MNRSIIITLFIAIIAILAIIIGLVIWYRSKKCDSDFPPMITN